MIHVAIAGAGAISDSHIEGYLAFSDRCKIVAIVNRSVEKAQDRIERYNLADAVTLQSVEELNSLDTLDLVSNCLPPALHCESSVALLKKGIHVLCEKPLASSVEECDKMIAAANEGGAWLSTVSQNRYKPDVQKVKKLCESGLLGKMYSAIVTSLWWRGTNYHNLNWRGRWETEGGGCTFGHGIHHIDLMLWLMGEVESITAMAANMAHTNSELEDISMCMVRFCNGAVGSVITSLLHHNEEQRLLIDAERGGIDLPFALAANVQRENGFPAVDEKTLKELQQFVHSVETKYTGHTAQIDDMLAAIETGCTPSVTGEDGRRAIEFIAATYQSAFTGEMVKLPITTKDPYYTAAGIAAAAPKFHQKTINIERFTDDSIQVGGTL